MASPKRPTDPGSSAVRLAVRPVPLVVLAATGVATVFGGWMAAVGGAVVYVATVGVSAVMRPRDQSPPTPSLAPPREDRPTIKSREILALTVRIRKAHRELYDALVVAEASVRSMLVDSYERIGQLVDGTRELATRADRLQLHIDAARARGEADAALAGVVAQREAAAKELVRVADAIEAVTPRLLAGSTIEMDDAVQVASELAGELEHMKELISQVG